MLMKGVLLDAYKWLLLVDLRVLFALSRGLKSVAEVIGLQTK